MSKNQNTPCGCRRKSGADALNRTRTTGSCLRNLSDGPNPIVLVGAPRFLCLHNSERDAVRNEESDLTLGRLNVVDATAGGLLEEAPHVFQRLFHCHVEHVEGLPAVLDLQPHCSSPVVAESEADTSDAPAMTVQEGGGIDAAPGVEGVSPASSTPRFVAVGEYVYDRAHNLVAGGWPGAVATKWARDLNADVNVAGYMEWEDAK